jgi:glycine dehydrogenase
MSSNHIPPLPYDASTLPRERARHYIPATDQEVRDMCAAVGVAELDDLFHHIPPACRMVPPLTLPEELPYDALYEHMVAQSRKNRLPDVSFVGDALSHYAVQDLVPYVAGLRELLTAYTPYQPERSQGTLMTQWLYQSCLVALTQFEAINASQYDRASALVEALHTAARLSRYQRRHFLLAGSLFPQDVEVVRTLLQDTLLTFDVVPIDAACGTVALSALEEQAAACGDQLAGIVFPQAGSLGCLEDVDRLTDLAHAQGARAIVVMDPMLLATGGLKPPGRFGREGLGADLLVGEGQPLAIAPHFGGPGLGIFGVRFNSAHKQDIRSAPGRFVGAGSDSEGRAAKLLVLSTREQHIRREKATSNICTNQGFVATLAAAAMLGRGEQGMQASCARGREMARLAARTLMSFTGVSADAVLECVDRDRARRQRGVDRSRQAARRPPRGGRVRTHSGFCRQPSTVVVLGRAYAGGYRAAACLFNRPARGAGDPRGGTGSGRRRAGVAAAPGPGTIAELGHHRTQNVFCQTLRAKYQP